MSNIIRAVFEQNSYTATATRADEKPIWQWNYGQILQLHGLDLPKATEVHFSHSNIVGDALIRIGTTTDKITEVAIPETFLEHSGKVTAYVYCSTVEHGQTEYKTYFKIEARAKPEAWDKPEDAEIFHEAIEAVNEAAGRAETAAGNAEVDASRTAADRAEVETMAATVGGATARAEQYSAQAVAAKDTAVTKAEEASTSSTSSQQALADLLAMLGTDIATLVGGKIPVDQIPSIATTEIYPAESKEEMDALVAQNGDICIRGDENKSYIFKDTGWVYLASPTDYSERAGHANTADTATNATMINNHRMVEMQANDFPGAVKDPDTYYLVW